MLKHLATAQSQDIILERNKASFTHRTPKRLKGQTFKLRTSALVWYFLSMAMRNTESFVKSQMAKVTCYEVIFLKMKYVTFPKICVPNVSTKPEAICQSFVKHEPIKSAADPVVPVMQQ